MTTALYWSDIVFGAATLPLIIGAKRPETDYHIMYEIYANGTSSSAIKYNIIIIIMMIIMGHYNTCVINRYNTLWTKQGRYRVWLLEYSKGRIDHAMTENRKFFFIIIIGRRQ